MRLAPLVLLILGLPLCGQEPATHIKGRVVDEAAAPLEGVRLSLGTGGVGKAVGTTDADGRFRVALPNQEKGSVIAGGLEFLDLEAQGRLSARITVGHRSVYGFRRRHVGDQDVGTIVLPKGKPIQVRIRKARGRPLAGAVVIADSPLVSSSFPMVIFGAASGGVRPQYLSRAVTDEKGAAVIHGIGEDGVRVAISADGYYRKDLAFHSPGMPLVVVMEESGFVSGKVVDHEGKPVRALLNVLAEVKPTGVSYLRTLAGRDGRNYSAEDGTFRLNLDYRHRYRISASVVRGTSLRHHSAKTSGILVGPQQDLMIQLDKPKGVEGGVAVHVVDAESGEPVSGFRAAAIWNNHLDHLADAWIEGQFESTAQRAKEKGKLMLPPPPNNKQRAGGVMIKAEGYATLLIKNVDWDDDKPVKVTAKLLKELPVHGVVVDKKTEKPVVGALVWAVRKRKQNPNVYAYSGVREHPGAVRTDAKGRFRLHGLGKGKHKVHARHPDHPDLKPKTINLKPEAPLDPLTLKISHGVVYAGKITGVQPGPGWNLKLAGKSNRGGRMVFLSTSSSVSGPTREIAPDGKFAFKGLKEGDYTAYLVVPRVVGPAMQIKLPSGIEIEEDAENVELDVTKALPGRVQGKVTVTGIPAPTGRLAVVAEGGNSSEGVLDVFMLTGAGGVTGPKATIRRDGTFDLALVPGKYKLKVVDVGTGIVLWQGDEQVEVESGKSSRQELALELALVRVRLKPKTEGGKIVANHLGVRVDWPKPDRGGMVVETFGYAEFGVGGPGVSLADGQREIDLYLPARETKLLVLSNARTLKLGQQRGAVPPLAEHELTPEAGKASRIEILVPPPPEIDDSADEKAEERAPAGQVRRSVRIKRR